SVPLLPPRRGKAGRARGERGGSVPPPRPKVGVGKLRGKQGVTPAGGDEALQAFFQERNGFAKAPGHRVGIAEGRHQGAPPPSDTQAFRHLDALLEERNSCFGLSLLHIEVAKPPTTDDLTKRFPRRLADAHPR